MATTNTDVSNASLGHIGAKSIANFDDTSKPNPQTIYCRLYLEKARDALLRSHLWRFAKTRVELNDAGRTPPFEWDNMFNLPADFLRRISVYDGSDTVDGKPVDSYELEGSTLLINSSTCYLRYIRKVTDPDEWDPLFSEMFELTLARKLAIPLSQDLNLKGDIDRDLQILLPKVRAMDRAEGKVIGRYALKTWTDGRHSNVP